MIARFLEYYGEAERWESTGVSDSVAIASISTSTYSLRGGLR